jgi:hypothetical protein
VRIRDEGDTVRKMTAIKLTEEQVLWFRARRSHLAGEGATDVAAAAAAILGAQAQQTPPSLHALSLRTRHRPTAAEVESAIVGEPRTLVRTWGQRDTLHLFEAREDWPLVAAAKPLWHPGRGADTLPPESALDVAYEFVRKRGLVTRADLEPLVPPEYVEVLRERAEMARMDPVRLGAGRLIWRLAGRGDACVAEKVGAEQTYAARGAWFPGHPWEAPPPEEAAIRLTRRYLGLHGPATPQDVAHFFGTKVSHARPRSGRTPGRWTLRRRGLSSSGRYGCCRSGTPC